MNASSQAVPHEPSPNTLQAWRTRIADRASELRARLDALDALEKIRARELEQLLVSHNTTMKSAGSRDASGRHEGLGSEGRGIGDAEAGCQGPYTTGEHAHAKGLSDVASRAGGQEGTDGGARTGAQPQPMVSRAMLQPLDVSKYDYVLC